MKKIKKNKKALSELVSYVLLIVIAMGLSVGVYAWLKVYVPSNNPNEECTDTTALSLNNYNCTLSGSDRIIQLSIENKGYFNIAGFFIKATNRTGSSALPTTALDDITKSTSATGNLGRYLFTPGPLAPAKKQTVEFIYTDLKNLTKIQIQPFIIGNKSKLIISCPNTIIKDITDC